MSKTPKLPEDVEARLHAALHLMGEGTVVFVQPPDPDQENYVARAYAHAVLDWARTRLNELENHDGNNNGIHREGTG